MNNNETTTEGIEILKRIEEGQEPLKDIASYYDEARKQEELKRQQQLEEEIASLPPVPLTAEQHIAKLTEAVATLTEKLDKLGENK